MTRGFARLLWSGFVVGAAVIVGSCGGSDDGPSGGAQVVACEGTCSCEPAENTCSCQGGTTCDVECNGPCTVECQGNARCDIECPANCTLKCPGTAGCDARIGPDSQGTCTGTASCEVTCEGDCTFECGGTSQCIVHCAPGHDCSITSCGGPNGVTECGDGVLACRTSCPPPADAGTD